MAKKHNDIDFEDNDRVEGEKSRLFIPAGGFKPKDGTTQPPEATPDPIAPLSYFARRMAVLGITEANNSIGIKQHCWVEQPDGSKEAGTELVQRPIFTEVPEGIDILVYSLDRRIFRFSDQDTGHKGGSRWNHHRYSITRLEKPVIRKDGSEQKYNKPRGLPSYPFFPPGLVDKYDRTEPIKVLYLTEGFFKAMAADLHGIDCVGMQSITCLTNPETNKLWEDITLLCRTCKVQRLVWLLDGDCMNITSKVITEETDIYMRPNGFFATVHKFWEITSSLDVVRYFAHINTDTLEGHPKGLDDMLCSIAEPAAAAKEMNDFSVVKPGKIYPGTYITRMDITAGTFRVRDYLLKEDVTRFYMHHREIRPDLARLTKFTYNGSLYKLDEETQVCEIELDGDVKKFIRVGNDYYKIIEKRDAQKRPYPTLKGFLKGTIIDDYGKYFLTKIKKFDDFCIEPSHHDYQRIVYNCYNLYEPLKQEPEEGDCHNIIKFFKHLFGEEPVTVNYLDGSTRVVPRYELLLDFFTLLYTMPWHILPIICLVSRERQTGKTTFHNFVAAIFGDNAISIGNEDLKSDFNSHWAGKIAVMVDETKIERGDVSEKIKRMSTANSITMNAKGKDQTKLAFFAKFFLNSNFEDDFLTIDDEEIRFWVFKVKKIDNLNPQFEARLYEEIPAFLQLLVSRKMITEYRERHWFATELLQTEALQRIKDNSKSTMEKRIRQELGDLFDMQPTKDHFEYCVEGICKDLLNVNKSERIWVIKTLHKMGFKASETAQRGAYPRRVERHENKVGSQHKEIGIEYVKFIGKMYVFNRYEFTKSPLLTDAEADALMNTTNTVAPGSIAPSNAAGQKEDLPF